ncbi:MAG TPA: acetolactate synthase small subunit [Bacteroidales bacterium]|nr:acetolactate synthase small subunit [Bacteroidales bacterium]HOU96836.1 acetolactate synthase small subunit [Bacteroidales bacterium]
MKKEFTLSIFTENRIGILNQITIIMTRRQINIESVTSSESAVKGIQLITLVVRTTDDMIRKVARQIEKIIDVVKVFVHNPEEIVYQEIALFKVSTKSLLTGDIIDHLVRSHNIRFLDITSEYMVIEKTGHKNEIIRLLNELEPFGILQYARSGRVAITKQVKELDAYLKEMDEILHNENEKEEFEMIK